MAYLAANIISLVYRFCDEKHLPYDRDVDLSELTYMKTGGRAQALLKPLFSAQVAELLGFLSENGIPYKTIGNTSNLLFLDEVDYPVLISSAGMTEITVDADGGRIFAQGGAMMPDLARAALMNSLTGFEGLEGIPGTIGGGIFMNAGAYGAELKDKLVGAELALPNGSVQYFTVAELQLSHRSSVLRREASGGFVCSATFQALRGNAQRIFGKMEVYHAKRHKYQDFMYPNLGSIFSGSPYRALGRRDRIFKLISAAYYFVNYEFKLFRRESPINRKWLNDIVLKRFPLHYPLQPFSDKTLNCLVNRGQGTAEMVRFIRQMEDLVSGQIPLENEIVDEF